MSQFIYRIRPKRSDMLSGGPTEDEAKIVGDHFAYLSELSDQGVVLTAGRTLTEDEHTFGIVILETESDSEARHIMENDPAVKHGIMSAELFPFRVALWSSEAPAT